MMDTFKIAFWKKPLSKDDSFIDLFEAELVHANVTRSERDNSIYYTVIPIDPEIRKVYGEIELEKLKKENHWKVVNSKNNLEEIFLQLISSIENAEGSGSLSPEVERTKLENE